MMYAPSVSNFDPRSSPRSSEILFTALVPVLSLGIMLVPLMLKRLTRAVGFLLVSANHARKNGRLCNGELHPKHTIYDMHHVRRGEPEQPAVAAYLSFNHFNSENCAFSHCTCQGPLKCRQCFGVGYNVSAYDYPGAWCSYIIRNTRMKYGLPFPYSRTVFPSIQVS